MNDTACKGRRMLKAAGVLYIILSALGLLAALGILAAGVASVPGGEGAALGFTVAIIALGALAVPLSALGLVAGILSVRWCARPDRAGVLLALGAVLAALTAVDLLLSLGGGSISALAGDGIRLALAALYTAGAWQNRQSLQ